MAWTFRVTDGRRAPISADIATAAACVPIRSISAQRGRKRSVTESPTNTTTKRRA
jgi:hypothetical protein